METQLVYKDLSPPALSGRRQSSDTHPLISELPLSSPWGMDNLIWKMVGSKRRLNSLPSAWGHHDSGWALGWKSSELTAHCFTQHIPAIPVGPRLHFCTRDPSGIQDLPSPLGESKIMLVLSWGLHPQTSHCDPLLLYLFLFFLSPYPLARATADNNSCFLSIFR